MILTSGTEQYLITCTNKKYIFLLTTTLTISETMKEESSDIELNGLSDKQIVDLLREVNQEVIQSAGIIYMW